MNQRMSTRMALQLAGCLLLAVILAFFQLGERPLSSPSEARYGLIAREMLTGGDWVQPHLNGVRYYEKPPLLYWSLAASYRLFGQSEAVARLPSAAAYVATVAVTFFLAGELLGASAAPLAALVFATSAGPFLFGRFLNIDTLFVFWLTVSLLGLVLTARGRRGPLGPLLFWGGLSLAGLTKGLAGLVFPLGTAATYALFADARRLVRDLRPRLGGVIVALVLVPWHLILAVRDPDFVRFYLLNEHVLRFFNAREPIDYTPMSIGGFWLATALWFLPWSLFLPPALASPDVRKNLALPLVWSAWVLVFFTASAARLERYALPAFPALAVVVAAYWRSAIDARSGPAGLRVPAWIVFGSGGALLSWLVASRKNAARVVTWLVTLLDGVYRGYFPNHPDAAFAIVKDCLQLVRPFAVLVLLVGGAAVLASRLPRARLALTIWLVGAVGIVWFVELGHRLVAPDLSQRNLAPIIRGLWEPGASLVVSGTYEDYCGVSLYTGLPTRMLDGESGDLLFGYRKGDAAGRFLTHEAFERLWSSGDRVFVVGERGLDIRGAVLLAEGPRTVLVTNRRPHDLAEGRADPHGAPLLERASVRGIRVR
jgi:4-amino-4-deoxy-L-arabinose transferase-like glycosyltransferase